ncbi:hypothetical protein ACSNOI_15255, partial [Actinomadura kijaniata]|uniref:hypothetical protein n=1 Tax=Actinomadura kijaniata TaxID=46161 RepID=UPI003F1DD94E
PHATATLIAKQETVTARGTAPACIKRKRWPVPWSRTAIKITNRCGKTMRVKVIVKRGKDSPCRTLRKNKSFTWQFIPPYGSPSYHKTVTC